MNNGKNYVFGILALVVSVAAITLAYAGFTQTLTINGSATVKAVSWNVHFTNVNKSTTGTASFTTNPSSTATTISSWVAQLASPGDTATITFDVENTGNFGAQWTGLTLGTVSCSGPTNATTVCDNISYELFEGSTKKTTFDSSVLAALGGKKSYKLVLTYKESNNPNVLPVSTDATVTIGQTTFTYTQSGNATLGS